MDGVLARFGSSASVKVPKTMEARTTAPFDVAVDSSSTLSTVGRVMGAMISFKRPDGQDVQDYLAEPERAAGRPARWSSRSGGD